MLTNLHPYTYHKDYNYKVHRNASVMVFRILNIKSSHCLQFTWKLNAQEKCTDKLDAAHSILMRRHTVAFMGFLCSLVMHAQRLNIGIAMVTMVNSTNLFKLEKSRGSSECFTGSSNFTSSGTTGGEFSWNPEMQGYILSAGFFGYILTQIPGGVLARQFGTKPVLLFGVISASFCNLLSPMAARQHPYFLTAVQLLRGMGQGLQPPAMSVLMSKWFPRSERGFLSAFIYCGYPVGAFIAGLSSGALCEMEFMGGWPLVFYTFGAIGVLVGFVITIWFAETPATDPRITKAELNHILKHQENDLTKNRSPTPWAAILTSISTYAFIMALFGQYWMAFYFLSVHPTYLGTILHIPITENGILSAGSNALQAVVGFCACCLSFWLSRRSQTQINSVRKGFNLLSCILFSLGIFGIYLSGCDSLWNTICLFIATASVGFGFAGSLITAVDMSPTFCGPLMGFASTVASLAGFLIPVTVGQLTNDEQNLTQWGKMFLITTAVSAGSGFVFLIFGSADIHPYDPASQKIARKEISTIQENGMHPSKEGISSSRL
ncbi:putative inorganic phosphate cotransporter [Uloborus diversus]|uniref:putative inorganic phosphate cotransporter n=1 Tax=Uloborus diversus TaxID=327109 RepID=UPI002409A566|nr:putative inorganic phosphate cotransporter [Uloborus diversus]